MPVGKNALKRVTNNGYSKVNVSAPDMEHSTVAEPVKESAPAVAAVSVKAAPKKNNAPKTKKAPTKAPATKKVEKTDSRPDGFVRVELGGEMPIYLL